jgi:hypothetical protein
LYAQITELTTKVDTLSKDKARLEARIAALEPKAKPLHPPLVYGVTITTINPLHLGNGFEMPDAAQLARLKEIVFASHPQLKPKDHDAERFDRQFAGAFHAVSLLRRTDTPDRRRYPVSFMAGNR